MTVGADAAGLPEYVLRTVIGDIFTTKCAIKKNKDGMTGVEREEIRIKDPVIVFFANGNCQVYSYAEAEKRGFTRIPNILNLNEINDASTPAGMYKFAIDMNMRQQGWMMMEEQIINRVLSTAGAPLPIDAQYSEKSAYFKPEALEV